MCGVYVVADTLMVTVQTSVIATYDKYVIYPFSTAGLFSSINQKKENIVKHGVLILYKFKRKLCC